jgi:hypothetical protein
MPVFADQERLVYVRCVLESFWLIVHVLCSRKILQYIAKMVNIYSTVQSGFFHLQINQSFEVEKQI